MQEGGSDRSVEKRARDEGELRFLYSQSSFKCVRSVRELYVSTNGNVDDVCCACATVRMHEEDGNSRVSLSVCIVSNCVFIFGGFALLCISVGRK